MHDVVTLIETLDSANIRFVHFSSENELRSRAFGTKLGLETGNTGFRKQCIFTCLNLMTRPRL